MLAPETVASGLHATSSVACPSRRWGSVVAKKKQTSKRVRITQVRSGIGRQEPHRRTIRALGIKRHQQSVEHELTPAIQGMIDQVSYMIEVEEIDS